jgi:hypothetical protein
MNLLLTAELWMIAYASTFWIVVATTLTRLC